MTTAAARSLPLNTPWLLRPDPANLGLTERWHALTSAPPSSDWRPAIVPAAWQKTLGQDYFGIAWYRCDLTIPHDWSARRSTLRFETVATDIRVWVNGSEVGGHTGDYLPFDIDITAHTAPGSSLAIICRVDQLAPVPATPDMFGPEGKYETWSDRASKAGPGEIGYPGHITKGFHDVLSIAHGGIWQPVHLLGFGALRTIPDGIAVHADAESGSVEVIAELSEPARERGCLRVTLWSPESIEVARGEAVIEVGAAEARFRLHVESPLRWSPDEPRLYRAVVEIEDSGGCSQHEMIPFGFRSLITTDKHILLNGSPIFIRGVLHWGHEPRHMAPAPTPDQVRSEFVALKEHGFNCVCLCMWYPPRYFYDIADEMGMLLWQEHPVWQSPMEDKHLPEYKRLYSAFMRRDRNHPSVVIVSATCEHPKFHSDLAKWWWAEAKRSLPGKLHQVQTSSFAWSDPDQTDLYDEHTYENTNRWPQYLEDLQHTLKAMKVKKPFVMGETIVFSTWPNVASLEDAGRDSLADGRGTPWWRPKYLDAAVALQDHMVKRYGTDQLSRFLNQANRFALANRKSQIEQFRMHDSHAAVIMNHIRDVPGCTCGFLDDFDEWRFAWTETRGWLADRALLLRTPENRWSFQSGESITLVLSLSNFTPKPVVDECISVASADLFGRTTNGCASLTMSCRPGQVGSTQFTAEVRTVASPEPLLLSAHLGRGDGPENAWVLHAFPPVQRFQSGCHRLFSLPFTSDESSPDSLEKGYSRGFGLPIRQWMHRMPDPSSLCPDALPWSHERPVPPDARVILAHRLTTRILDWLSAGGRLIHFASRGRGALPNVYEWFFGQCPLVIEHGPIGAGDSRWIVDLLGTDLTRTYARMIPSDTLGITDLVDPLIRYVYIHDAREKLRFFDGLFMTRVGNGLLMVSSLDHHDPAGQYLLARMIEFMQQPDATAQREMPASMLAQWAWD